MMRRVLRHSAWCAALVLLCAASGAEAQVADAALRGDAAEVRALLRGGADVNAAHGDGMTALHWAAQRDDAAMTEVLLHAGAKVAAVTRIGNYTPLHVASRAGSGAVVKLLLKAGADANAVTTNSGATPLHLAAASGSVDAVSALLDAGATPDAREAEWGQTPLMLAAAYNRAAVIAALLARGADPALTTRTVDFGEQSALDAAAARRRTQALNALRPEGQSSWTPTPTQMQAAIVAGRAVYDAPAAANGERPQEDQAALDDGAVPGYAGQVGGMGGLSALHHAVRQGNVEAVRALLDGGADIDQLSGGDRTSPLLMAAINGQFDIALELIARGANPNLLSNAGAGPLYAVINAQWAPRSRYPQPQAVQVQKATYLEVMEALLEAGADPNVRLRQHLWYFAFNNCGNANCGLENLEGSTPFWRAAYSVDVAAMKLLVQHGADPAVPAQRMTQAGARPGAQVAIPAQRAAVPAPQRDDARADQRGAAQQGGAAQRAGAQQGGATQGGAAQGGSAQGGSAQGGSAQGGGAQGGGAQQRVAAQQRGGTQQGTAQQSGAAQQGAAQQARPRPVQGDAPARPAPSTEALAAERDDADADGRQAQQAPAGVGVFPVHAAAGVGYGNGFAANSHRHAPDGWMPALRYLVEELGADVNARDANGYTPLHHAAARGDNEMILYLVEKGADVKAVARNGRTTADMANGPVQRLRPFPETVALLVKLGAINNNRCVSC